MRTVSKSKERKKISQFSKIIEKNKNMNKKGYKEKAINENKQIKTNYSNKLSKVFNMRKIKLRKNISGKEIKYDEKAFNHPLKPKQIYKSNNIESYRDVSNILLNIIIISLLISLTNEALLFRHLNYFSSIIITFKETGKMNFLSQDYGFKPDSVFVNDNEREFSNQSMEDLLFY